MKEKTPQDPVAPTMWGHSKKAAIPRAGRQPSQARVGQRFELGLPSLQNCERWTSVDESLSLWYFVIITQMNQGWFKPDEWSAGREPNYHNMKLSRT